MAKYQQSLELQSVHVPPINILLILRQTNVSRNLRHACLSACVHAFQPFQTLRSLSKRVNVLVMLSLVDADGGVESTAT